MLKFPLTLALSDRIKQICYIRKRHANVFNVSDGLITTVRGNNTVTVIFLSNLFTTSLVIYDGFCDLWIRVIPLHHGEDNSLKESRMSVMFLKHWVSTSVTPECLSRM